MLLEGIKSHSLFPPLLHKNVFTVEKKYYQEHTTYQLYGIVAAVGQSLYYFVAAVGQSLDHFVAAVGQGLYHFVAAVGQSLYHFLSTVKKGALCKCEIKNKEIGKIYLSFKEGACKKLVV